MVVLLLVVNLQGFLRVTRADDDYNSLIWDRWLDQNRAYYLRSCLNLIKSAKCQVQLYNNYFNLTKEELDLNCCIFVKIMGKKCTINFVGCSIIQFMKLISLILWNSTKDVLQGFHRPSHLRHCNQFDNLKSFLSF